MNTPKQKCKECGHISDQFIQPATVECEAYVNYQGEFQWWKSENFECPNFEERIFMCEKCYSKDLEDYVEDKEPTCRYCGSHDLFEYGDNLTCSDCASRQE